VGSLKRLMLALPLAIGCATATTPKPLTYLASERPQGPILRKNVPATGLSFSRGGLYFLNFGFRPARGRAAVREEFRNEDRQARAVRKT
jgi:hypothetical protein